METPPEETKKKEDPKPVLQESSYLNLIDLETEIRPPPYAAPIAIPSEGRNSPGVIKRVGRAHGN